MIREAIEKIEAKKINLIRIFSIILILSAIRDFIEISLLNVHYNFLIILHFNLFYIAIFLSYVLIITVFSKEKVGKVINISLIGFLLIFFPPLIDHFIFGRNVTYCYHQPENLLKNLSTFFFYDECIGKGQIIEIILLNILASFYVYCKTKSLMRSVSIFIFICLVVDFFHIPTLLLNISSNFDIGTSLYYLLLSSVVLILLCYRANKKMLFGLVKNMRPVRSFYAVFLVFFGSLLAGIYDVISLIAGMLAIFFTWQFSIIVNDIYDQKIDNLSNRKRPLILKILSEKNYFNLAAIFLMFAILFGILAGLVPFLILCACIVIVFLYSFPAVRLRKYIFSSSIVGICSALAFLLGYFSQAAITTPMAVSLSIILAISISLGVTAKDFKDYEGDKRDGVKTIFTVFGLERGKTISAIMLAIAFLMPMFLLNTLKDLIIILTFAIVASLYFKKKQDYPMTIVFCILLLVYVMLRLKSFI